MSTAIENQIFNTLPGTTNPRWAKVLIVITRDLGGGLRSQEHKATVSTRKRLYEWNNALYLIDTAKVSVILKHPVLFFDVDEAQPMRFIVGKDQVTKDVHQPLAAREEFASSHLLYQWKKEEWTRQLFEAAKRKALDMKGLVPTNMAIVMIAMVGILAFLAGYGAAAGHVFQGVHIP